MEPIKLVNIYSESSELHCTVYVTVQEMFHQQCLGQRDCYNFL